MAKPFSSIRSAAIDGRAHNAYYRKTQLKKLHDKIVDKSAEIQDAIREDTNYRPAEIKAEYWLALQVLADSYNSIDPVRDIGVEYNVANHKDAPEAREPVGIVLIEPATHTLLFSLISALAPAVAAGNCVIVRVNQTMLKTPRLVLRLIEESLDGDIITVTNAKSVSDSDIGHRHIRVLQNGSSSPALATHLVSRPDAHVIAIVERDADLRAAAEALVGARFGLGGKSPYAPDIVLVNEWVVKEFLGAAAQIFARLSASAEGQVPGAGGKASSGYADEISKKGLARIVSSGSDGAVVELTDRAAALAQPKLRERSLIVHTVSSVEDAIDVSNSHGRLAAAYVFTATPGAAKYLCQFLDSDVSFVNQFPTSLLFNPIAPPQKSYDVNSSSPYDQSLFTLPKPQYVSRSKWSQLLDGILLETSRAQVAKLEKEAATRLPEIKRKDKQDIGFFDQGVLTGGVIVLSTLVTATGFLIYYTRARLLALY